MVFTAGVGVEANNPSAIVNTVGDRSLGTTRAGDTGELAILVQKPGRNAGRTLRRAHNRAVRINTGAAIGNRVRVINCGHLTADQHKAVDDALLVFVLTDDHAIVVDSSQK